MSCALCFVFLCVCILWFVVRRLCCVCCGVFCVFPPVFSLSLVACGAWFVICGVCFVVCGLRCGVSVASLLFVGIYALQVVMMCALWFVVCGSWVAVSLLLVGDGSCVMCWCCLL